MALINCSECGKEVSDKALSCPNCGNPITPTDLSASTNQKVEVELTNKKWKTKSLYALGLFFLGILVMTSSVRLGFLVILASIYVGMSARIGAWWDNG